jgi:sulfate permease, SulP family
LGRICRRACGSSVFDCFGIIAYTAIGPEHVGRSSWLARSGGIRPCCANRRSNSGAHIHALCAGRGCPVGNNRRMAFRNSGCASSCERRLALVGMLSACLQMLYGLLGGGRLIKFIPYQVVTGFLSSIALIIVLGQVPKPLGLPKNVSLWQGFISPGLWQWQSVVIGVSTAIVTLVSPQITRKCPAVILGLFAGALAYSVYPLSPQSFCSWRIIPLLSGVSKQNFP